MENSQFVNPTNLSIADLISGSPNPKEATNILTKWYSKVIDVDPIEIKQLIIEKNIVFPIFYKDKLEDIVERYVKMFPLDAKLTAEQVKDMKDENPDGKSGGNLLRSLMSLPQILKAGICVNYGQEVFADKKFIAKLARLIPKFCTCNEKKI